MNTDEEGPFDNEFVWNGRMRAMRHFAVLDDCEGLVEELDVAVGSARRVLAVGRQMRVEARRESNTVKNK